VNANATKYLGINLMLHVFG